MSPLPRARSRSPHLSAALAQRLRLLLFRSRARAAADLAAPVRTGGDPAVAVAASRAVDPSAPSPAGSPEPAAVRPPRPGARPFWLSVALTSARTGAGLGNRRDVTRCAP